ncbi:MAG TPA: MFS transporter [Verrucomicrobiae bacterium]|nr:MFS transporter [Verrucomicrobiae bacterium]
MIRKLLPILGITFVDIVGFSMLIPVLPYFVTHFGVSPFVVGILFATFSLCGLIAAPIWGNLSDRIGRKTVLIVSQIGATISWAMMAFAPNIGIVFVARILEGVSGGNISITQAYVADVVEAKDRGRAFGLIGAMFGAGMVFGPAGGGVLFTHFGFPAPFLAAAALQFLTLILTITLLPESREKPSAEERVGMREILRCFQRPRLAGILYQKLALALALYGWFAVIALYLAGQLRFTLAMTDYFFSGFAAFNVFCNAVLVGRISERFGDRRMSNLGLASLALAFCTIPFIHTTWQLAPVMMLFSFGMALANTGIIALISNAASDREQGTVLGTSSSLDSLSGTLAPPVSTGLLARYGPGFAGFESLLLASVALLMGLAAARGESPGPGEATGTLGLASEIEVAEIADA